MTTVPVCGLCGGSAVMVINGTVCKCPQCLQHSGYPRKQDKAAARDRTQPTR